MEYYAALKAAAKSAGIPLTKIGATLGKSATYVHNGITRKSSPAVDNAAAMLAVCGYKLAAIPDSEPLPDTALVLTTTAQPVDKAAQLRRQADKAQAQADKLRAQAQAVEAQAHE